MTNRRPMALWLAAVSIFLSNSQLLAEEPARSQSRVVTNRPLQAIEQTEAARAQYRPEPKPPASGTLLRRGAEPRNQVPAATNSTSALRGPSALDVAGPLVLVLALIALVTWLITRGLPRGMRFTPQAGLTVLGRHYLSGKQSLCLVRLGRRLVFLGVTPDRISTLAMIDDAEEAAAVLAAVQQSRPASFTAVFNRLTSHEAQVGQQDVMTESAKVGSTAAFDHAGVKLRGLLRRVQDLTGKKAPAETA